MRLSILDFYQPKAVESGLNIQDLIVFKCLVDMAIENQVENVSGLFKFDYEGVLNTFPTLSCFSFDMFVESFNNLEISNILVFCSRNNELYYKPGKEYSSLWLSESD